MKIALVQMDVAWEDREANLARADTLVGEAAGKGADTVVLPEMFSTGFSMKAEELAEPENGPTASFLSGLARQNGISIIAGLQTRILGLTGGFQNRALVYDRNGELLANYGKLHLFSPAGENGRFRAGNGPVIFRLDGVPASVFICYDLRFPEAFREVASEVLLIFVIANWPEERQDHWTGLLRARAIENQCFVAGVNRAGRDGNGIAYGGGSCIYGPWGGLCASAGSAEEILLTDISPEEAMRIRAEFPFLKDRTR